ncbi:tlde1 domain-containing protein [Burkholderia gladioli]
MQAMVSHQTEPACRVCDFRWKIARTQKRWQPQRPATIAESKGYRPPMPVECTVVLNKHRNDGKIDDVTVISGIRRAYFRLHPVGRFRESDGCITLPSLARFTRLRAFLEAQPTFDVPGTKLKAYGRVTVR